MSLGGVSVDCGDLSLSDGSVSGLWVACDSMTLVSVSGLWVACGSVSLVSVKLLFADEKFRLVIGNNALKWFLS